MTDPNIEIRGDSFSYGVENIGTEWSRYGERKVHIGKFCQIGCFVKVILGGDHNMKRLTTYPFGHIYEDFFECTEEQKASHPLTKGDVYIGNDVWISSYSTIYSGVHIGDGAVICGNSVVVKDVEPYSVVGGNPAKHIKYRFETDVIQSLLRLKWWNRSHQWINEHMDLLLNEPQNVEAILECL